MAMDENKLTRQERMIRGHIRNAFLIATVREMEEARENYPDAFSQACLDEMIDECRAAGVESHGDIPCN
jgi:hypothetical protein